MTFSVNSMLPYSSLSCPHLSPSFSPPLLGVSIPSTPPLPFLVLLLLTRPFPHSFQSSSDPNPPCTLLRPHTPHLSSQPKPRFNCTWTRFWSPVSHRLPPLTQLHLTLRCLYAIINPSGSCCTSAHLQDFNNALCNPLPAHAGARARPHDLYTQA